jgi:hypothetical protein
VYVAGSTDSKSFPTQNPYQGSHGGNNDAFVTKFSPSGAALVYSTYLGGISDDDAKAIAVDASGNVYVAGYTGSANFPTQNPFQPSFAGGTFDGFVVKLSSGAMAVLTTSKSGAGTITSSPSGINCGSTCTTSFDSGTSVTLTAIPDFGSAFTSWTGCDSPTGSTCIVSMTSDKTVAATFTTDPTLECSLTLTPSGTGSGTITSSPSGINCGATCSASYASGTSVTLTATPDAGSYFTGWSYPCSGTGTCTVTLSSDTRITAAFSTPSPYNDTVQKLYLGYYQRPADPEGLAFWINGLAEIDTNHDGDFTGENTIPVLSQFAYSDEARALYNGDITSSNISTVVDSIYLGLFGRHAETDGLAFWVNSFNTGASTPASILWNLMQGAQGSDAQSVQNKLIAASRFTHVVDPNLDGLPPYDRRYAGPDDCVTARQWLAGVSSDAATIPSEDAIRAFLPAP